MSLFWQEDYNLGIKIIDNQHQKFVATMDTLYEAIKNNQTEQKLAEIFQQLEDYVALHFMTEEKYFAEFNYDGASEHIEAHNDFKKQLAVFKQDWQNNKTGLSFAVVDFLENWLLTHLATLDKKYVKCFKEHGLA